MNSLVYVLIAYAAVWVGLFAYLYHLQRRQVDLREDLDSLARLIKRRAAESGAAGARRE